MADSTIRAGVVVTVSKTSELVTDVHDDLWLRSTSTTGIPTGNEVYIGKCSDETIENLIGSIQRMRTFTV